MIGSGPGAFPWTIIVTRDQQRVFAWIRSETPTTAVVQMDPIPRGRATWSLIPSWARRRMAAGLPISLMNNDEYRQRSERAHAMYAEADPRAAWRIARELRIDYVYVDGVERAAHGGVVALERSSGLFEPMFASGDAAVYRVGSIERAR
jgi:hypothetical protein